MSRTGKFTKTEADEWGPGLCGRHHELLCKGYRKIMAKGSSVDGGGLKTWNPPPRGALIGFAMEKHPEGLRD